MLNHPIPYGSLGKIIPELFDTKHEEIMDQCQTIRDRSYSCDDILSIDQLTHAYLINSIQVMDSY